MQPENRDGATFQRGNPLWGSKNAYVLSITKLQADLLAEEVGMGAGTDQVQLVPNDTVDQ